ncbi:RpiB/LacA/LacB family sugar-phosphate isomerase [Dysgonomonas macrotermitis]|uniref:Ribose 5-phosphate isomerase B n=1 Tax=Dysgonomonas macrotermitis TaxID=1346286 RepID=A0A1M5F8M4_9BACT|nr:RpiB/LacA/LacB family sugar-phosphate isomerase [Dysgonomonas macrotermitis]SHF87857.1 ribose 5-phosphate isomerase B [Dysgonomonas macrotermitis]
MTPLFTQREKPIGLACDHAGFELKQYIKDMFDEQGLKYIDFGTHSGESVDYPDFGHRLGNAIDKGICDMGIAVCSTGNGFNMTLNRHKGVRAALCWNSRIAYYARTHNAANVLTIPGSFVSEAEVCDMILTFFNCKFEGGRHARRVEKIVL